MGLQINGSLYLNVLDDTIHYLITIKVKQDSDLSKMGPPQPPLPEDDNFLIITFSNVGLLEEALF